MPAKKTKPARKPVRKIKLAPQQLTVKYADTHDLLDKLQSLSQSITRLHSHALKSVAATIPGIANPQQRLKLAADADVLGPSTAFDIVTQCAGETDVNKQLGDIPGLDSAIFQSCVQSGVARAGYKPLPFACDPSMTLWQVITAIQDSPK
jgi:hypothetical protein